MSSVTIRMMLGGRALAVEGAATRRVRARSRFMAGMYHRPGRARIYWRSEAPGAMKAVVISTPHHASFQDQARPRPGEGQILVRVGAAGICMSDVEIWKGTRPEPYVRYPVIPGHEWCGTVEELGPGVQALKVGQRVAVEGHNFC